MVLRLDTFFCDSFGLTLVDVKCLVVAFAKMDVGDFHRIKKRLRLEMFSRK